MQPCVMASSARDVQPSPAAAGAGTKREGTCRQALMIDAHPDASDGFPSRKKQHPHQ